MRKADHRRRLEARRNRGYLLDTSKLRQIRGTHAIAVGSGGCIHPALKPVTRETDRLSRLISGHIRSCAGLVAPFAAILGVTAMWFALLSMTFAPFELAPATGALVRLRFDKGDGSDGAFATGGNINYSAIGGVAVDGNGVYTGQFTTFGIGDGHTVTLDQTKNLLLATGTVTLGEGATGIIDGDGNGEVGATQAGAGTGAAGIGAGHGNGATANDGGAGAGGRLEGTDGGGAGVNFGQGGKQTNWLNWLLTGDTTDILAGAGGGRGGSAGAGGPNDGGNGGATLWIIADTIIMANGFVWTSDGAAGDTAAGVAGGGGGGAGGTIGLMARVVTIAAAAGTVLGSLGGAGGAGAGGGLAGGAGSIGHIVLLFTQYFSVGGTTMDTAALAARTDPDAEAYNVAIYSPSKVGNQYEFSV